MSHPFVRHTLRLVLVLALITPLVAGISSTPRDIAVTVETVALSLEARDRADPLTLTSSSIEVPFTMVAVTWEEEGPTTAAYRIDDGGGLWSNWRSLGMSDDHQPEAESREGRARRGGTDLVYSGPSERVQFRFTGSIPVRAEAVLIDTSAPSPTVVERLAGRLFGPAPAAALPAQPNIRPRSEWDPLNQCPPREIPEEIQVTTAIVHHTGIDRAYSSGEVPGIILGYCLYHRNSRGFDDIAYNILVDRFGTIWEGRAGGVDKPIRGGHSKGFSSYSTGIALIGNFTRSYPGWSQRQALEQLLAWKLAVHNLDPTGTTDVISMGSHKWDEGVPVSLDTISGHRDAQATACPGAYCYSLLPTFRANTAAIWSPPPADYYDHPVVGDFDGDGSEEGAVYRRVDGTWWLHDGGTSFVAFDGANGSVVDGAVAADIDDDGTDEIVVRSGPSVSIMHLAGNAFSAVSAGSLGSSAAWSMAVGDVDADGAEDAVFVNEGGAASVLTAGAVAAWGSIGAGHGLTMVGDFDGDGAADLAGLRPTGIVDVAPSTGTGFAAASVWGDAGPDGGWAYALAGDFDGDGDDDVAAFRESVDTWYGLRSNGSSFATIPPVVTPSLNHWSEAFAFDFAGDGRVEVVALNAYTGTWHLGRFDGLTPVFTRLEDAPNRVTIVRNDAGEGDSFLSWFGQEFAWIRTDLGYGVGGEADATTRTFGVSRYETAALISRSAFASADVVFVGTGVKYPDALTGGSAAVRFDAPMLLTAPTSLPASTRAEIQRLGPDQIVLLGGTAAVSAAVEAQLAGLAPGGVTRIGGADRYETAALISRRYFEPGGATVYVATGMNFPDALAGVAGAHRADAPILLVRTDSLPAATAAEMGRLAPSEIVILGGPVAVSDRVVQALSHHAPVVRRVYGRDRYATAAAVSSEAFPGGADLAFLAIGTNFPDAVAAGPAAAHLGGPLLLTRDVSATDATLSELRRLRPSWISVIGAEGVVGEDAIDELEGIGVGGLSSRVSDLPRP